MEIMLLGLLLVKHFVADYVLQTSFQYKNKGIYGHRGGLLHAGIHVTGTALALALFLPPTMVLILALADGLIHYHIDWAKETISRTYQLKNHEDRRYWLLFGMDQLLHQMTYIGLVWAATLISI
jgi:hypothetical protein